MEMIDIVIKLPKNVYDTIIKDIEQENWYDEDAPIDKTMRAIANGTILPKEKTCWIPVSEGLPKPYEEVIVTDIETSDTYVSQYMGNGYWDCDNGIFNNRIIAWQPKPKPYKTESEE